MSEFDKSVEQQELPEDLYRQFSLAEIKAATNNFHQDWIISDGGFGNVYRGTIDGGTTVAIKRYQNESFQGVKEFRHEVLLVSQFRHPHLVSLVGFCVEQNEMIIVYEYMSRGTLDASLCDNNTDVKLGWKQRLQICIGVARGLHYLHAGAKYSVIRRIVKSSNILLDDEYYCKLSDFGLSKTLIRMDSRVRGTCGYAAPEYEASGELTEKCDVLFYLKLFVVERHRRIAPDCFKKYLEIACSRVQLNPNERPNMGEVEVTLELALELQEKADSEMKGINLYDECTYKDSSFVDEIHREVLSTIWLGVEC
ncbi:hypothetical protein PTKIN_Ptkin15bG0180000 [Pterospermum kingtungense]